jgi:hypothetical protein
MPVVWERNGEAYFAAVESATGGVRYRLIVERLDGAWDWSVWKPNNPGVSARHGVADTILNAMRAAEQAAR